MLTLVTGPEVVLGEEAGAEVQATGDEEIIAVTLEGRPLLPLQKSLPPKKFRLQPRADISSLLAIMIHTYTLFVN